MSKSLYIIDGHAHIYAAYYAPMGSRLTAPTGEPTKAPYIFTQAILGLMERRKPEMLAVAMDSIGPTFRHKMYDQYKMHRPPMPDDLPRQIDRIEQILDAMKIPILRVDGYEADDIIGTLSRKAAAEGLDVFICSGDKDLLQLIDERTSVYNLKKDTVIDLAEMRDRMHVTPEQFVDCLALQGDASDNIPGVPDVGPKTALNWISKYGSIDNLYEHIDEIKGKRGENLRQFREQLHLSRKLVTIDCQVPLEIPLEELESAPPDSERLRAIFTELGFSRLLDRLDLEPAGSDAGLSPGSAGATAGSKPQPGRTCPSGPDSLKTVEHDYRLIDTPEKFDRFFAELCNQKIFALDTETTSVAAMRADLVGLSFAWEPHRAFYLPVKAPLGTGHLDLNIVRERLGPILADPQIKKIGQNIKYDLLVLENARMPVAGVHFDTMVASYCLDPERRHGLDAMALSMLNYQCVPIVTLIGKGKNQLTFDMVDTAPAAEYACEDADITWRLYELLAAQLDAEPTLRKLFDSLEMPLVPVLGRMEHNGVALDAAVLRNMSSELAETRERLTEEIYEQAGVPFNIDSPKQLAEVLFDRLGLESLKATKTSRSTDAGVLERLSAEHPIVELILEYRTITKLQSTYVDKLGTLIDPRTRRVHASFNQTVTTTGRLSSSDPNLQNIPIRTELGSKIRSAFVPASDDCCILAADYSQIELRFLAAFSGDKALGAAFAEDRDIHRFVASQIYGVEPDEVTSEMRAKCKAVNFGIIYGQGAYGLSRGTGMSVGEAKRFIDDYFARYSSIRAFMDQCIERARDCGYAETILGRRRRISGLTAKNAGRRALAERLAVNTVIQGSAADLIKRAMVNIQRRIDAEFAGVKMILQIHDELVFELPQSEIDTHQSWIRDEMTGAIELDVPLKVDMGWGASWLEAK